MPVRTPLAGACLLSLALAAAPAGAAIHCVATSLELQQALAVAVADTGDDEIRIMVGSYLAPSAPPGSFRYVSSQTGDLVLSGGWSTLSFTGAPSCDVQLASPALTLLQAAYQVPVLVLQPGASTGSLWVRNLTLAEGSAATNGGGLYAAPYDPAWSGNLGLQSLRVLANEASNDGAGVYAVVPHGYLRIENTVFAGNVSGLGPGAGAELIVHGASSLIANVTVAGNSSGSHPQGAGLRVAGSAAVLVVNSVFHDNAPFDLHLGGDAVRLHHDHYGSITGLAPIEEVGSLGGNPLLGGGSLGLTPMPGSPLVNYGLPVPGGLPQHDVDGHQRVVGPAVDLGAFEAQVFADGYEGADDWERPPPGQQN